MNIPKRFKLHEAVGEDGEHSTGSIRAVGNQLIAVGQAGMAIVPIVVGPQGSDLPWLGISEKAPDCLIPPKAWATAVQGKSGEGIIVAGERTVAVRGGPDKPWITYDTDGGTFPSLQPTLDMVAVAAPIGHIHVEMCLDAEELVRISRAIGAAEGVRLRFLVNVVTGKLDAAGHAHGAIEIRPVREPDAGSGILMAVVIN